MQIIRRVKANGVEDGYQLEQTTKQGREVLHVDDERQLHRLRAEISKVLGHDHLMRTGGCTSAEAHAILDRHAGDTLCRHCTFRVLHCRECTFDYRAPSERYYFLTLLREHAATPRAEVVQKLSAKLDQVHQSDPLCSYCKWRHEACRMCVDASDSPLERELLLALLRHMNNRHLLQSQVRIRRDGTRYDWPQPVDRASILTVADYFVPVGERGVCIYADGLTYHYESPMQIQRDRRIDGQLQDRGYRVRRFTTDEIRQDPKKVVSQVNESVWAMEKAEGEGADAR